jgi:hypothetical protein
MRPALCLGLVCLLAGPGRADTPKLVLETWEAAYYEGARAGHVHTTVHEVGTGAAKRFRTTRNLHLKVKRYQAVIPLRVEVGDEETAAGKAVAFWFTQFLEGDKKLRMESHVENGKLVLSAPGQPRRELPWKEGPLGMYRQDNLFRLKKLKPGDSFSFMSYEMSLGATITVNVKAKELEAADVLVASKEGGKLKVTRRPARLLRVEVQPGKVTVGERSIQLPVQVFWLDKELRPLRSRTELPGLGQFTLYRTTKEVAEREGVAPELLPDLGLNTLVKLKQTIEDPYDTSAAVYRVKVKGAEDAAAAFARDARQQARNAKGESFELHVRAVRAPGKVAGADKVGKEHRASSYFLDSDDPSIKKLAEKITGGATDPWRKAQQVEKWVHDNMTFSTEVSFTTAAQTARSLTGDCRQHAMLTAALCRAAGVPSRTALGLIYSRDPGRSPVFGFHMWTEVWVRGHWVGLDAILGKGSIGATHLKLYDSAWSDTRTLAPLLPLVGVLSKLDIDVVSVK